MSAEHQCVWVLHGGLHSVDHLVGLSLEESSAATHKNSVPSEDNLCGGSMYLIVVRATRVVSPRLRIVLLPSDLAQVQDVAPRVARRVQTCDLHTAELKHLLVVDGQGAPRDVVL